MIKPKLLFALALTALIFVDIAAARDGIDERLTNELSVRLHAGVSIGDFIATVEANNGSLGLSLTLVDLIPQQDLYLLQLEPENLANEVLDALEEELESRLYDPLRLWTEFGYEGETAEGRTGSFWLSLDAGEDLFNEQYPLALIGVPGAHPLSTGGGTVVAVLDTGIDASHPVFASNVSIDGYDFVDDDANPDDAGNGLDDDGDGVIDEMTGHGTFVASLVTLVAPDVTLLPIRVLDSEGTGTTWRIAKGIYYALDHGAHIINASFGSTYDAMLLSDAVADARAQGVVVIAAAGNSNADDPEEYPAANYDAFGVAALDDMDKKAAFSNFDESLDFAAPGTSLPDGQGGFDIGHSIIGALPGGGFAAWEGTSLATPLVSGAAALVRTLMPAARPCPETFDLVRLRLELTAVDVDAGNPEFNGELGEGRIAVDAAAIFAAGDLDLDGAIGIVDLLMLVQSWGCNACAADLDGDGAVTSSDLLTILGNWS